MAVPEIMEAHGREPRQTFHEPGKLVRDGEGPLGLSVLPGANQRFGRKPHTKPQQLLRLLGPVSAQFIDGISGEGDGSVLVVFGGLEAQSCPRFLKALGHGD